MYREVLEEAKAFESLPEEFALAEEEKGERRKLDEKVLQAFGFFPFIEVNILLRMRV